MKTLKVTQYLSDINRKLRLPSNEVLASAIAGIASAADNQEVVEIAAANPQVVTNFLQAFEALQQARVNNAKFRGRRTFSVDETKTSDLYVVTTLWEGMPYEDTPTELLTHFTSSRSALAALFGLTVLEDVFEVDEYLNLQSLTYEALCDLTGA